jgi:hypothetical protein
MLMRDEETAERNAKVVYYFFDFNDAAKQTVEGMVRSIIYQLVSKTENVPDVVLKSFKRHQHARFPTAQSPLDGWVDILRTLFDEIHRTFAIIDALDECSEAEQQLLISTLQKLAHGNKSPVKWMLTCRSSPVMVQEMTNKGFLHTEMQIDTVDKDIRQYLSTILEKDPSLFAFSATTKDLIVESISAKSVGM